MNILLPFLQNYVQVWVKYILAADKRAKISYWVILNVTPVASRDAIALEISCCWKTVHASTKQIVAVSIATNFTRKGTYLPSIVPSRCYCGWTTFNPPYPNDIQLTCLIALHGKFPSAEIIFFDFFSWKMIRSTSRKSKSKGNQRYKIIIKGN